MITRTQVFFLPISFSCLFIFFFYVIKSGYSSIPHSNTHGFSSLPTNIQNNMGNGGGSICTFYFFGTGSVTVGAGDSASNDSRSIGILTTMPPGGHLYFATFEEKWETLRRKSFKNLAPKGKGFNTAFNILISSLLLFSWFCFLILFHSRTNKTRINEFFSSPVPSCCSLSRKRKVTAHSTEFCSLGCVALPGRQSVHCTGPSVSIGYGQKEVTLKSSRVTCSAGVLSTLASNEMMWKSFENTNAVQSGHYYLSVVHKWKLLLILYSVILSWIGLPPEWRQLWIWHFLHLSSSSVSPQRWKKKYNKTVKNQTDLTFPTK